MRKEICCDENPLLDSHTPSRLLRRHFLSLPQGAHRRNITQTRREHPHPHPHPERCNVSVAVVVANVAVWRKQCPSRSTLRTPTFLGYHALAPLRIDLWDRLHTMQPGQSSRLRLRLQIQSERTGGSGGGGGMVSGVSPWTWVATIPLEGDL
jgi:hypothetical protein